MARELNKLTALTVKSAPAGMYGDGGSLWLIKSDEKYGKWILRVHVYGRRREMGLGTYPRVSLKDARAEAEKWRRVALDGKDPIKQREADRRAAQRNMHILRDVAADAFESHKTSLKGDGKAGRWMSPLELHILPKLGGMPVAEIDQIDIRDTLRPIWKAKPDTAVKALNRLNLCIRHAGALGLPVDLQATDRAKLLLGSQDKKVKHIPSLPWQDTPAFYQSLNESTITQLALRLLILTAVRASPLRFARLEQFDVEGAVWTIPADMMKGQRGKTDDFIVPLSPAALGVIEQARPFARDGFLFPSMRKGVISDATMGAYMSRAKLEARPHGFRSSFRTWVEEKTETPRVIAEECLAHSVRGKVESAYNRSQVVEKRRIVMDRWGAFVSGQERANILDIWKSEA
ncbi:site-specific integrase [uncultured Sulfitobacter sp.]|uniref:tyrosine-type recombinase/integrase n=1 Tax=uncultured Sulfitobacter sp. TaxID=191468 RepID=UPI0026380DC4|nr:site-specific integrase [uncultured Sulfitobacter sp.]